MNQTKTPCSNGQPRKTLASQLDRLDKILDVLSDGINETVGDIVRDTMAATAKQTLAEVVRELLRDPETVGALLPQAVPVAAPTAQPAPTLWQRFKAWAGRTGERAGELLFWLGDTLLGLAAGVGEKLKAGWERLGAYCGSLKQLFPVLLMLLWQARKPVLLALLFGVGVGLGCYWAGPVVSSIGSGLAGFAGSLLTYGYRAFREAPAAGCAQTI
jgi:hypothetical protein